MKNEKIVEKMVKIAIGNGWIYPKNACIPNMGNEMRQGKLTYGIYYNKNGLLLSIEQILFGTDFAKYFWGEGKYYLWEEGQIIGSVFKPIKDIGWTKTQPVHEYYLQQIVILEGLDLKLKYIEKFLSKKS